MKYIVVISTILPSLYLFSYARYEWKNNKLSSIGSIILAVVSIVFPAVMLFTR